MACTTYDADTLIILAPGNPSHALSLLQGNHPALQLLRQRATQNSLPRDRRDNYKLGLVVEGGGMRGAVSAGALLELGNLGFRYACMPTRMAQSRREFQAIELLAGEFAFVCMLQVLHKPAL